MIGHVVVSCVHWFPQSQLTQCPFRWFRLNVRLLIGGITGKPRGISPGIASTAPVAGPLSGDDDEDESGYPRIPDPHQRADMH